jgi:hypothetical protein
MQVWCTLHYTIFFIIGMLSYVRGWHAKMIFVGFFTDVQAAVVLPRTSVFDKMMGLPAALGAAAMHAVYWMLSE